MVQLISLGTAEDAEILKKLWRSRQTFCLLGRNGPDKHIAQSLISRLPDEVSDHHFGVFTSGSTGTPKLVIGQKSRTEKLVRIIHEAQSCEPVQVTIGLLPLSYSFALVNQWLWSLIHDRLYLPTPGFSDPAFVQSAFSEARAAMVCLVGSQLRLLNRFFSGTAFPGIIRLNFAGERFPQNQLETIRKQFPNALIYNNYGCTEALPRLTVRAADESEDPLNIGEPLKGIRLMTNKEGKLHFNSPFGAIAEVRMDSGYSKYPEWIPTGDFAHPVTENSWRLAGRANEVFKRYGEKVSVQSVLSTLAQHWNGEIVSYSTTDPHGDETYSIVMSPEPDRGQLRTILSALRSGYTQAHWPIRLESLEELPKLQSGKADLAQIKKNQNKKLHWRQRI